MYFIYYHILFCSLEEEKIKDVVVAILFAFIVSWKKNGLCCGLYLLFFVPWEKTWFLLWMQCFYFIYYLLYCFLEEKMVCVVVAIVFIYNFFPWTKNSLFCGCVRFYLLFLFLWRIQMVCVVVAMVWWEPFLLVSPPVQIPECHA